MIALVIPFREFNVGGARHPLSLYQDDTVAGCIAPDLKSATLRSLAVSKEGMSACVVEESLRRLASDVGIVWRNLTKVY